jgi:hypothetical protein
MGVCVCVCMCAGRVVMRVCAGVVCEGEGSTCLPFASPLASLLM